VAVVEHCCPSTVASGSGAEEGVASG